MQHTISVISAGGGTGKTTTAVTLADYWPTPVTLIDTDSMDTKSATYWLTNLTKQPNWQWINANGIPELLNNIHNLPDGLTIIDTPPRINDIHVRAVATASNLVLTTGMTSEIDSILETVRDIRATNPQTRIMVVLTRDTTTDIESTWGQDAITILQTERTNPTDPTSDPWPIPLAGIIHTNAGLKHARNEGRLPTGLKWREQRRLNQDARQLVANIQKAL